MRVYPEASARWDGPFSFVRLAGKQVGVTHHKGQVKQFSIHQDLLTPRGKGTRTCLMCCRTSRPIRKMMWRRMQKCVWRRYWRLHTPDANNPTLLEAKKVGINRIEKKGVFEIADRGQLRAWANIMKGRFFFAVKGADSETLTPKPASSPRVFGTSKREYSPTHPLRWGHFPSDCSSH